MLVCRVRVISVGTALLLSAVSVMAVNVSAASAVPLSPCVDNDNGDPVVDSFEVTPTQVDVSSSDQTVHLTATAHDTGGPGRAAGLAEVRATLGSFIGVQLEHVSGDTWAADLLIPQGSTPGQWGVDVVAKDDGGRHVRYAAGFNLPASFGDGVTVVDSSPDNTGPTLDTLDLGATSVDTTASEQTLDITATSPDGATVADVHGELNGRTFHTRLELNGSGTLRGELVVPRGVGSGTWTVQELVVLDAVRNSTYYHPADLSGDLQGSFSVTSATDQTKPQLSALKITPSEVDLRGHSVRVNVQVRARDTGIGIDHVFASIFPPSGFYGATLVLHRVSGDPHDGIWRGHVTRTPCQRGAGLWRSFATTYDVADNTARLVGPRFPVRTGDNQLTKPRVHVDGPHQPAVVRFPEIVTGVSRSSAFVQTHVGRKVTGTWHCVAEGGARTSCADGRVRVALFTPTSPWRKTRTYDVVLNPEHTLQMRDLAGNAYRRALISNIA